MRKSVVGSWNWQTKIKICHFHPHQAPFISLFLLLFQIAEPIELTDLLVTGICWESPFEHPPPHPPTWGCSELTHLHCWQGLSVNPGWPMYTNSWFNSCVCGLLKLCRNMIASSINPFRHAQHWRPNAGSLWKHINKERTKTNQTQIRPWPL